MEKIENIPTSVAFDMSAGVASEPQAMFDMSAQVVSEPQTMFDMNAEVLSEPQTIFDKRAEVVSEPQTMFDMNAQVTSEPQTIFDKRAEVVSESPAIQILNNKKSISLNSRMALGFSFPPILPLKEIGTRILGATTFQAPVKLRLETAPESDTFLLPVDPVIGINGRNVITRRYVAKSKSRGSIKELWSQDDYDISISGVLCEDKDKSLNDYLKLLQKYCNANESIHITCDVLNNGLGITRIAIESYDFPFTKGKEYQSFSIKAYSDESFQLLDGKK